MSTNNPSINCSIHHGRNLKTLRREKGIKQETLSELTGIPQQTISKHENRRVLEDAILEKYAKALGVTVEDIKEMEEPCNIVIENTNIYSDNDVVSDNKNIASDFSENATYNFNPLDKVIELYERLLKTEQERSSKLEEQLGKLESRISELENK